MPESSPARPEDLPRLLPQARDFRELYALTVNVGEYLGAARDEWWRKYRARTARCRVTKSGRLLDGQYFVVDPKKKADEYRQEAARQYRDQLRSQLLRLWQPGLLSPPERMADPEADIHNELIPWIMKVLSAGPAIRPAAKPEQSEGDGGAGSAPVRPAVASAADRKAVLEKLEPAARRAYLALQYAETKNERGLEDREAHEWLKEHGIDSEKGDLGELADYEVPDSLETFRRYVGTARNALDERKYTRRGGRKHGGSIVKADQIEYREGDET